MGREQRPSGRADETLVALLRLEPTELLTTVSDESGPLHSGHWDKLIMGIGSSVAMAVMGVVLMLETAAMNSNVTVRHEQSSVQCHGDCKCCSWRYRSPGQPH